MSALLTVENLVLGYERFDAVKSLSLTVAKGSVVTLIGANGAGKTTTLRGLSGLVRARSGKITFAGTDITNLPAYKIARLGIVQVPEGRQIYAGMTLAENLALGAYFENDRSQITQRLRHVVELFPRLGERLSQSAGLLSGGEQQMLAMGMALMADPKLLLLDEPSMGLAPLFIEEIFRIISALKSEGRTILLVEQNANAALEIADYAYVLEDGQLSLEGSAVDIALNPKVAAAYLGM